MKLSDLAEAIRDVINSNSTWTDLSVGSEDDDYVLCTVAQDPLGDTESYIKGLYIIPTVPTYDIPGSSKRGPRVMAINKKPIITLAVCFPYDTNSDEGIDVASWAQIKQFNDLREDIIETIISNDFGYNLEEVENEIPIEVSLDIKWYVALTEFTYEGMLCGNND